VLATPQLRHCRVAGKEGNMHVIGLVAAIDIAHLLDTYGYWAVFLGVAIESTGIPFPGETILLSAAIYAGTTGQMNIAYVIGAAIAGAIIGDNIGYWAGREGGYRLLRRYGKYIRVDEGDIKVGRYLFRRFGAAVVFFGRWVSVLRAWAAFLAGVNRYSPLRFFIFNAAGAVVWATFWGLAAYMLGENIHKLRGLYGIVLGVVGVVVIGACLIAVRRRWGRLKQEAERAFPGPIDAEPSEASPSADEDPSPST
jgi:membrane protein DedA with SNARE-associated domain